MTDYKVSEQDEMLTMLEEMQDQIEELQKENLELKQSSMDKDSEIMQMQSEHSSIVSALKREIQKKSETIVSLNARLEKLSAADLVLKKNAELEMQNAALRKQAEDTEERASTSISHIKEEYAGKETILNQRLDEAVSRKKEADDLITNCKKKIREEAERITDKERKKLKEESDAAIAATKEKYTQKKNAIYSLTLGLMIYSAVTTLFTGINSDRLAGCHST